MTGNELNDVIAALRKFGMKVPKSVKTPGELCVCIESQCEGGEEEESEEVPTNPTGIDANAEPVEMSSTVAPSLAACIAEQERLARRKSVR